MPDKIVKAPSRLDKHYRDQDLIFYYEAALKLGHKANYELTALNFCSKPGLTDYVQYLPK